MKPELLVTLEDADNLRDALSIPKDRHIYLIDFINETANEVDNIGEVIGIISKKVDNTNEFAFAMFHYGAVYKDLRAKRMIGDFLENFLGRPKQGKHVQDEAENNSGPVKK